MPSPDVWKKYLEYQEKKAESPIRSITFRSKDKGWKHFSLAILFENGVQHRQAKREDLYLIAFSKGICLRPSCYSCNYKSIRRQSDITLADFWGIKNILPEMDDDRGTSLVLVNSNNGQVMMEKIKAKMLYKEVDIDEALKYNRLAIRSVNYNQKRKFFLRIEYAILRPTDKKILYR